MTKKVTIKPPYDKMGNSLFSQELIDKMAKQIVASAKATTPFVRSVKEAQGAFNKMKAHMDGWRFGTVIEREGARVMVIRWAPGGNFIHVMELDPMSGSMGTIPSIALDAWTMVETPDVPISYSHAVLADNPVSYWRLNEEPKA